MIILLAPKGEPSGTTDQDKSGKDLPPDALWKQGTTKAKSPRDKKKHGKGSAANVDLTSNQHLETAMPIVFRNNRNQCYLNSVALLLLKAAACTNASTGGIQTALSESARLRDVEILGTPVWKNLLRGWRQPRQQRDVLELLHFISARLRCPALARPRRFMDHPTTHPHITMNRIKCRKWSLTGKELSSSRHLSRPQSWC